MDGAKSGWQTFWNITLPQLRATAVAVLILLLIAAYQAFDEFYNLLGMSTTPDHHWNTSTSSRSFGAGLRARQRRRTDRCPDHRRGDDRAGQDLRLWKGG